MPYAEIGTIVILAIVVWDSLRVRSANGRLRRERDVAVADAKKLRQMLKDRSEPLPLDPDAQADGMLHAASGNGKRVPEADD